MPTMLLVHAAATFALIGLVWTVQLAIYPQFVHVGADGFGSYHARYARGIAFVVGPLMVLELVTGIRLMAQVTPGSSMAVEWSAFGLLLVNWAVTGLVSVPLHKKLGAAYSERSARLLAATNWIRTGAWTLRGVLVAVLVQRAFGAAQP